MRDVCVVLGGCVFGAGGICFECWGNVCLVLGGRIECIRELTKGRGGFSMWRKEQHTFILY